MKQQPTWLEMGADFAVELYLTCRAASFIVVPCLIVMAILMAVLP